MGLVQDQGVVLVQVTVFFDLCQQHPVGQYLDVAVFTQAFEKPHFVPYRVTYLRAQFLCHPGSDTTGRDAAWLGMTDEAIAAPAHVQAELG